MASIYGTPNTTFYLDTNTAGTDMGAWGMYPVTEERVITNRCTTVGYTLPKIEEVSEMRGLFELWIIDPGEERVVLYLGGEHAIVADDEGMAKLIAAREHNGEYFGKVALRKYHYYVRRVCDVPKPKEVTEIKLIKDE